ncbi:MAG: DNA translocase FtsK 4TM domain-containing protein [Pseudomonadota bacterium]
MVRGLREGASLLLGATALYFLLALITYDAGDPGWSSTGYNTEIANAGGKAGAWFADVALYLFGYVAYLVPALLAYSAWILFRERFAEETPTVFLLVRWSSFFVVIISACGLVGLHSSIADGTLPSGVGGGGVVGAVLSSELVAVISALGATLLLLALLLSSISLLTGVSWLTVMDKIGEWTLRFIDWIIGRANAVSSAANTRREAAEARKKREAVVTKERDVRAKRKKAPRIEPIIPPIEISARVEKERQIQMFDAPPNSDLPPLSLLDEIKPQVGGYTNDSLEAMSRLLELKLADFGITAEVVAVHPGPVITRFELQLAPGVKVSRITGLAKDIARSMSLISVRVVEVIPGKSTIGIEIPNEQREVVQLSEILQSAAYDKSSSPLTLGLGKDIGGKPIVADLAKMPHLLVAGTTGSGKSVAVNAMLLGLLYKSTPQQVRLILVDPKMLELNIYDGIPHLLAPVVTDMKEAANALRWCVGEMERRYRLMAALGVRNIIGYNRKVAEAQKAGKPIVDPLYKREEAFDPEADPPTLEHLPYIVVVVDEFADMMMVVGKKVEELITRIAQKARAAGIHLLLATQRPSVDVITGLIKANIPTRVAFQVSSKVDSRTILDQVGAEQLLGHGDMLFLPPGTAQPERVHGAFVDDHEVHQVVDFLKQSGPVSYLDEITKDSVALPGMPSEGSDGEAVDALYDEAVAIVTETRKASISYVQRRLKIGYNRAARMIEEMEASGVVSPVQSNGNREVLAPPPVEV